MAALIAVEEDFDRAEWTRPEGYVEPDEEVANLYEEGFSTTWLASRRHVVSGVVHRTPGCLSREVVTSVDRCAGYPRFSKEP